MFVYNQCLLSDFSSSHETHLLSAPSGDNQCCAFYAVLRQVNAHTHSAYVRLLKRLYMLKYIMALRRFSVIQFMVVESVRVENWTSLEP